MKKVFVFAIALIAGVATVSAQYKASIGATVGTMEGVSFKGFLFSDNLALVGDLGFSVGNSPSTAHMKATLFQDGKKMDTSTLGVDNPQKTTYKVDAVNFWTLELNPNLVYQANIHDWSWGGISWFAGGGVSLGISKITDRTIWLEDKDVANSYGWIYVDNEERKHEPFNVNGKWGLNAVGGAELLFANIPLAVSLDFRPGYGMMFGHEKYDEKYIGTPGSEIKESFVASFFDWKVCASVRYVF